MNDATLPEAVKPPPPADPDTAPPAVAAPGHNRPPLMDPDLLARIQAKTAEFLDAGGAWMDLGEITTVEQAEKLTDFKTGATKLLKAVDAERKKAKEPHDTAAKQVQNLFLPILAKLERAEKKAKDLQTGWLLKLEREEQRKRDEARREAQRLREEAEAEAARAARSNDIAGELDSEAKAKQAEILEQQADRAVKAQASSATGGGRTMSLRTVKDIEITNINHLFLFFRDQGAPDLTECLRALALRHIRAAAWDGKEVPGTKVIERKVAA